MFATKLDYLVVTTTNLFSGARDEEKRRKVWCYKHIQDVFVMDERHNKKIEMS